MFEHFNLILIDDHKIVVKGLKLILKSEMPNVTFAHAYEIESARELIENVRFDLAIVDLHMDDSNTLGLISSMKEVNPEMKILVYSTYPEEIFALRTYKLGVQGYINKQEDLKELAKAVKSILRGEMYYSDKTKDLFSGTTQKGDIQQSFDSLSNRELEVTILLNKGRSVQDIEHLLGVSKSTASTYKRRIFTKLGISNVIELSNLCSLNGL